MEHHHQFWLIMLSTLTLLVLIGAHVTKSWRGLFVDARCKVSLSRLQIIFWTVTIMSAVVWFSFRSNVSMVHVPQSLWALLGISGLSTVGAEVIKGTKASGAEADGNTITRTVAIPDANKMGLLHKNSRISDARFIDIFKGEELIDHSTVDITKIQMFLISMFVFTGYIYAIMQPENQLVVCDANQDIFAIDLCQYTESESSGDNIVKGYALPKLTDGLVALLAISHAGYLSFKAAPKTPTA